MIRPDSFILMDDHCHIGIQVGVTDQPVNVEQLRAAFALSKYGDCVLDEAALHRAVEHFHTFSDAAQKDESATFDTVVKIAECVDARLQITVSDDAMSVAARITTAQGGNHVDLPMLVNALHEAKVSFGLQTQRTLKFISESMTVAPGTTMEEVIALGRHPEHGEDTKFKRLVTTPKERLLRPQPIGHGRVDMRDLGQLCTVKPGDVLMRVIPCTEGNDGKNVLGEVLPHHEGETYSLVAGEGARISDEDPNLLLADAIGLPMEIEHGMRVDDVLAVNEVNVGTGHINFSGSIVINGNVREGMKVLASGDIHVLGFVDSAYLESGGDILIEKGVIGHKVGDTDQYSCELKAEGAIHARNVLYSKFSAGGDVLIERELNHCLVYSRKRVVVSDQSGNRGSLIGGEIEAGENIEASVAGSEACPHTYLSISGEYEHLVSKKRDLIVQREVLESQLEGLLDAQLMMRKIKDQIKRTEMQSKITATLQHHHVKLSQLEEELEESDKALEEFLLTSQMIVKRRMFPNVHFKLAGLSISSDREYGPTKSVYKEGELEFMPV
ncbi:MAG: hypothetical protein CENE_01803 [Candidatus Celerinatantimonas neptuna]|nr:MAG: hypothetical protein CENE_01803 [Candidatus Celerinatantimonas neptuna]